VPEQRSIAHAPHAHAPPAAAPDTALTSLHIGQYGECAGCNAAETRVIALTIARAATSCNHEKIAGPVVSPAASFAVVDVDTFAAVRTHEEARCDRKDIGFDSRHDDRGLADVARGIRDGEAECSGAHGRSRPAHSKRAAAQRLSV
jgi:hypothetical protein